MDGLRTPILNDFDPDIDFDPMFRTYREVVEESQLKLAHFVKEHPDWIVATFSIPQLQKKFLPQDMADLFILLCSWLDRNCKQGYQIFLGCILFESRDDANNYYCMWCITKGRA